MNIFKSEESLNTETFNPILDTLYELSHDGKEELNYWLRKNSDHASNTSVVNYYTLSIHSEEYHRLKHENLQGKFCKIDNITRIQNPYIMSSYLIKKDSLIKQYGMDQVRVRLLLHGTKRDNITQIATENFNFELMRRHRYGRGVYFTSSIDFAAKFCDSAIQKCAILAYVLQAATCPGYEEMTVPEEGCDTSLSYNHNKEVIVKYDDDTFYPAYIIDFRSKS